MARPDLATPFMEGLKLGASLIVEMKKLKQDAVKTQSEKSIAELKNQTDLMKAEMDQQKQIADAALKFVADDKINAPGAKMDVFNKSVLPFLNGLVPAEQTIQPLTQWDDRSSSLTKAMQAVNNLPDDVPQQVRMQALAEQLSAFGLGEEALKVQTEASKPLSAEQQEIATLTPEELRKRAMVGTEPKEPKVITGIKIDDQALRAHSNTSQRRIVGRSSKLGGVKAKGKGTAPGGKVTADERNAAGFLGRMTAADEIFATKYPNFKPTGAQFTAASALLTDKGIASNLPTSWVTGALGDAQSYYQAAADWVRAKLRKESGAAIGAEEMLQEIRTYFPLPGEGSDVIKQKAEARLRATEQMRLAAGSAADQRPPLESFER